MKQEQAQEHTDEFLEIIKRPPNFLTKYAFVILLLLLGALCFFVFKFKEHLFQMYAH